MLPKLYTVRETAEIFRISRAGIMNPVARGQLPSVQTPGPTPKPPQRMPIDEKDVTERIERSWKMESATNNFRSAAKKTAFPP